MTSIIYYFAFPTVRHYHTNCHLFLSPQWPHSLGNLRLILNNSLDLLYNPLVDLFNNIQRGQLLLQLLCTRASKNDGAGV